MVVLRSFSEKDLLPGLEVRLLPHQLVGVSWYECCVQLFSCINLVVQDGGPREKIPSSGWYFSVSNVGLLLMQLMDCVHSRDEMGLGQLFHHYQHAFVTRCFSGKTVQMIATMAANMPNDDHAVKTTLIVVPSALLQQVSLLLDRFCSR